jgi:hypothetical protein
MSFPIRVRSERAGIIAAYPFRVATTPILKWALLGFRAHAMSVDTRTSSHLGAQSMTPFRISLARALALSIVTCIAGTVTLPEARADLFDVTGTFSDGADLGGTITIDTQNGLITAARLTVGSPDNLIFDQSPTFLPLTATTGFFQIQTQTSGIGAIRLLFPDTDLSGFSGGPILPTATAPTVGIVHSGYQVGIQSGVFNTLYFPGECIGHAARLSSLSAMA